MRYNIEDIALVSDDEVDASIAKKLVSFVEENSTYTKGVVENSPEKDTTYFASYTKDKSEIEAIFFNYLLSLNLIPILPGHEISYVTKVHEMKRDGKMAWHNDGDYSLAISYYLSDCTGGELEVVLFENDESDLQKTIKISPKKNRIVVLKGNNMHRVLPVKSGNRKSIQIFLNFSCDQND
jgi:hypothetical protein